MNRFGVSWQFTPRCLIEMLHDPDGAKVQRVMAAMLQMVRIEIGPLRQAYGGG